MPKTTATLILNFKHHPQNLMQKNLLSENRIEKKFNLTISTTITYNN